MQLFDPEAFSFVQSGLQPMQNGLVGHFDFSVGLRMADRGQPVRDMESRTKLSKIMVVELSPIVGDNGMRQSEPEDDGLLNEVLHLALGNLCQGLGFHPFGEVVDCDK